METIRFGNTVSTALQGLWAAQSDALAHAQAVAEGDLDGLAGHVVGLEADRIAVAANSLVLRTVFDMEKDVLDIVA